ncbi:MAG: hypothetical protein ABIK79_08005 [Chloroflexota bacterium]
MIELTITRDPITTRACNGVAPETAQDALLAIAGQADWQTQHANSSNDDANVAGHGVVHAATAAQELTGFIAIDGAKEKEQQERENKREKSSNWLTHVQLQLNPGQFSQCTHG